MTKTERREYFDEVATLGDRWARRAEYYRRQVQQACRFLIPRGARVLEIGCGSGDLLASLDPSRGLGIDLSPVMVGKARAAHPSLEFRIGDAEALAVEEEFDFVVLSDLLGHLDDVQACFAQVARVMRPDTRLILTWHNFLWQPILKLAERLGLKMPQPPLNWLDGGDVANLLALADLEIIRRTQRVLLPLPVPLVNSVLSQLPGLRRLCLVNVAVARLRQQPHEPELSVSVVVPTRNERGNIAAIIERTPPLGSHTEIIFVDGHSTDGTLAETQAQIARHPERALRSLTQDGTGKGDAVRKAFDLATGDVLMILDADLTVAPEELSKFFDALARGRGDLINGCRLVYPMEDRAMRPLNLLGNKLFALLFSWLLDQRFKDTLCGTKVLRRRDYIKIRDNRAFFGDFDPYGDFDLLLGASKQNLKIVDIPIRYRERMYGTTNIARWHGGWVLLKMSLFAYRKLKVV